MMLRQMIEVVKGYMKPVTKNYDYVGEAEIDGDQVRSESAHSISFRKKGTH